MLFSQSNTLFCILLNASPDVSTLILFIFIRNVLDFTSSFFIRNGLDFTSTFFLVYRGQFFMIYRGHLSFRNGCDVPWPVFFSQWAWGTTFCNLRRHWTISLCAIIWINFSSWFWVQMNLQVKWNALSSFNPRIKGRLFKRGLCWIESVLPPATAAPFATLPSPLLHLRRRHADLTGYFWDPAPETELQWISCTAICI